MQTYVFEGKNENDAIENACRQLNLPREELEIEVLEPGSAGIFGLVGGRKAKIRVSIPPAEEPEEELIDEAEEEPFEDEEEGPAENLVDTQKGILVAREALQKILELIPVEGARVVAEQVNGAIHLNIEGDRSGLLIGRKGRTLDALQFIINKIVNKSTETRSRVIIDSENYRERRRDYLVQMALKMGDKAKKIQKPVATNLLNPHDRRIVHMALRDDQELGTKGRGDGVLKKVVIIPKRLNESGSSRAV